MGHKEELTETVDIIQTLTEIIFYTQGKWHTEIHSKTKTWCTHLSNRKLNWTELKLLEKGLTFTPTPRNPNIQELTKDISEFTRKVRLVE